MISVNTYRLKNGLKLLHHFDGATKMVCLNLLYDVGSRDEVPGKTGLAHLMEHLMFTGSLNALSFDDLLQKAGGQSNAWTSVDMTNYYETLPAHNVELAFWLESDRLLNLSLNDESIVTQKSVVIEEFKQRYLNQPYGDLSHIVSQLAFKKHPYRWPTIGVTSNEIENADKETVLDFYHSHYAVNNLILCVSGNVTFDEAVRLTEKWFSDIKPKKTHLRNLPQEPIQKESRFLSYHSDVPQNLVYMIYHMGGRSDASYQACDMLSDVLSNGTSSRFYRNILVKTNLFTELDASITGTFDPGLFMIRGRLADGVSFDLAKRTIDEELETFLSSDVSIREIEKFANKYESNQLFESIGYAEKALKLCKYELLSKAEDVNHEIEKYRTLTPSKLSSVAQNLLRKENSSILFYGPNA